MEVGTINVTTEVKMDQISQPEIRWLYLIHLREYTGNSLTRKIVLALKCNVISELSTRTEIYRTRKA